MTLTHVCVVVGVRGNVFLILVKAAAFLHVCVLVGVWEMSHKWLAYDMHPEELTKRTAVTCGKTALQK